MIKRTEKTTAGYIRGYREGGIEGLALGHSPGKPHRLADTIATKQPVDVGIEAKFIWTLKLAILFVEREFGKTYTEKGMSKLLHRLGFNHTKASYSMELADSAERAKFKTETFPVLKKAYKRGN